jgi:hypothetical protein
VNIGDLVFENFEGLGFVMKGPYIYESNDPAGDVDPYDVVYVKFFQYGDAFEIDCDELKVISESR